MAIKWMGRYRDFVSAVVKHSNQYNRVANVDSGILRGQNLQQH